MNIRSPISSRVPFRRYWPLSASRTHLLPVLCSYLRNDLSVLLQHSPTLLASYLLQHMSGLVPENYQATPHPLSFNVLVSTYGPATTEATRY
jgi:hypothetical protein